MVSFYHPYRAASSPGARTSTRSGPVTTASIVFPLLVLTTRTVSPRAPASRALPRAVMTIFADRNTIVFVCGDNGGQPYFKNEKHPLGVFKPNGGVALWRETANDHYLFVAEPTLNRIRVIELSNCAWPDGCNVYSLAGTGLPCTAGCDGTHPEVRNLDIQT